MERPLQVNPFDPILPALRPVYATGWAAVEQRQHERRMERGRAEAQWMLDALNKQRAKSR